MHSASSPSARCSVAPARALRAVMDEIMLELMYHLPEMDNVNAVYVIDEAAIEERRPLSAMRRRAKESA